MPRTRRNVLIVLVIALGAALGIKLLLSDTESLAPPQPPISKTASSGEAAAETTTGARSDSAMAARRFPYAEDDLLPFGMSRSSGEPKVAVGPQYVGTDSERAAALREQAEAALKAHDAVQASDLARQGLALDPNFPQLIVLAAVAELAQSDDHLDEAERLARHATVLAPMYAEAHYNLACALARQERVADAAAELAQAIHWERESQQDVVRNARTEPDFAGVRDTPEFQALLREQPKAQ